MAFNFKKIWIGLGLVPKTSSTSDSKGELEVIDSSGKLNYHNGTTNSPIVTESHSATLTNKTFDADGTGNVLSNVDNANIKSGAAIDATKIADGSVTSTEFQFINTVTSNVQTQLNGKEATITILPIAKGGTNSGTALNNNRILSSSGGAIVEAAAITASRALASDVNGIPTQSATTATELGFVSGVTSAIQTQINGKQATITGGATTITSSNLTVSRALASDASGKVAVSATTSAELGFVSGVTSAIQTQLNTGATNLTTHINNTTDAHDASAISNVASGNLVATDVQAALNELQTDIDTRVAGPASSTDNRLVRFNGTTGKLVQDGSTALLSDTGVLTGLTGLTTSGLLTSSGDLVLSANTANAQTGSNVNVTSSASVVTRLTSISLISVGGYAASTAGSVNILMNTSGGPVIINNEDLLVTAANRIVTGTGGPLTLQDKASIIMIYNATTARHQVIGGTGAGGSTPDSIFYLDGSDVASWSTGDNATFLGGGTLAGAFVVETTNPLNGVSSYKYTQAAASLDDYLASPIKDVPIRFRGNAATLVFPYLYNGGNSDIKPLVWDVTNGAELTSTVDRLPASGTNASIYKVNVNIPSTCTQIRMGFHVEILNSGKILQFDDVLLTADSTVYADLQESQCSFFESAASFSGSATVTGALTSSTGNTLYSYNSGTGIYTTLKDIDLNCSYQCAPASGLTGNPQIVVNGATVAYGYSVATAGYATTTSYSNIVPAGQQFYFKVGTNACNTHKISVLARATSSNIVLATDTFSSDTAAFTYANAATYTLSTLANAPVGTYITFTYATSTNTRTQTTGTSRPTQTDADMNTNGIRLFARAYNAPSTAGNPACIAIQIGKGLKGVQLGLYKSAAKVTAGNLDCIQDTSALMYGLIFKDYNETTGILVIDAGYTTNTTTTNHQFLFSDGSGQTNGYVTINAGKTPALVGVPVTTVAVRGVNSAGTSISNASTVILTYNSTKTYDTHNALDTSTGVFTAPLTGYYDVSASVLYQNSVYAVANASTINLFKNGAIIARAVQSAQTTTSIALGANITDKVYLVTGDTLDVRIVNNRTGGNTPLSTNSYDNYFSVIKA